MITINPYLNFMANTEEAFLFYQSVFGGEFMGGISRLKDTPEGDKLAPNEQNMVLHVALPIGEKNMLMATDMVESMGHQLKLGNNISLSINTDSKAESDRIFNALAVGGTIGMPLADMFWAAYFGMCTDKFGIQWMVNCPIKK